MKLTSNVEDYLKSIFHLSSQDNEKKTGTNHLAEYLQLSPASVSVMLQKLKKNGLVDYEKYGKVGLTELGYREATKLIRKHRLWETFLFRHMNFSWDEVHEVAHQLEHIQSEKLIRELDNFLGNPKKDPHGHVIPDPNGNFHGVPKRLLSELSEGQRCKLVSVADSSAGFLKYVTQLGLALSSEIEIKEIREFDSSVLIVFSGKQENISRKFAENLYVEEISSK